MPHAPSVPTPPDNAAEPLFSASSGVHTRACFASPHLRGAERIAAVFGVSRETVVNWAVRGAPVLLIGRTYQACYADLWEWLKHNIPRRCED